LVVDVGAGGLIGAAAGGDTGGEDAGAALTLLSSRGEGPDTGSENNGPDPESPNKSPVSSGNKVVFFDRELFFSAVGVETESPNRSPSFGCSDTESPNKSPSFD
jgi:hypothetical protein